jgi:hypothetical protein
MIFPVDDGRFGSWIPVLGSKAEDGEFKKSGINPRKLKMARRRLISFMTCSLKEICSQAWLFYRTRPES